MLSPISIDEYRYDLPDDRIAKYPLAERDASKLLVWREGVMQHRIFRELPELLTGRELLVFNNTRVIPARLYFRRPTGALIEIFLLMPVDPPLVELAMRSEGPVEWQCTIGNLKRWPENGILERELSLPDGRQITLRAELTDRTAMRVRFVVEPTGENNAPYPKFLEVVETAGEIPIPPYLHRDAEASDRDSYQTVYGKREGAVAAPTAGLHFTPAVLENLRAKGVQLEELTLHVSAGTFRPIKTADALEHDMHREQVVVPAAVVEALLVGRPVVAVGTTSMRTLESLYWYGIKLLRQGPCTFDIDKLDPYGHDEAALPTLSEAIEAVAAQLRRSGERELQGSTRIYIFPGYRFRVVDALITNFHQPGSTLLLLIAAFTGGDNWKAIYREAMGEGYRFLSYGDSSVLFRR